MNLKKILTLSSLACAIALLASSPSHAFDLSLLKNDKEAKTHAYTAVDLSLAKKSINGQAGLSQRAYAILGESLNEIEKNRAVCELNLYRVFTAKLTEAKLSSTPKTVMNLMIVWRAENLIDDLFFEIMDQATGLNGAFGNTFIDTSFTKHEAAKAARILTTANIKDQDFSALFDDLKGASLADPGCSAGAWIYSSNQLSGIMKGNSVKKIRTMNIAARAKNIITDEEFALLEFYNLNGVQLWDLTLNKYLSILQGVKNSSRPETTNTAELASQPARNTLSSQFKDKNSRLTYRASLYYRFDSTQIGMISDLLKLTFKRMEDGSSAKYVTTFKDGSEEVIPVSPQGQYYTVRRLLRKDLLELSQSSFFKNAPITHEDLLTAALETGLINANMVETMLKIDDLWNPSVPRWKKIVNFAMSVTGTATLFLPAPYNVISSIALVFISGQIGKKTAKPDPRDNPNDIF